MPTRTISLGLFFCLGLSAWSYTVEEKPAEAKSASLLLVDAAGKEQKITSYHFTAGVRRLGWLAPDTGTSDKPVGKGKPRPEAAVGPLALVIRDDTTINFLEGVLTLVPLTQVRSIRFDNDKNLLTASAVTSGKAEEDITLTGTTKFKGINKVSLEAEVDKGDAGVATLTYQGGILRGGIKSITFPAPRAEVFKAGRPAVVLTVDDEVKKSHKVSDLQALYRLPTGREKLLSMLMFKKTLKLDMAKMKTVQVSSDKDTDAVWQVVLKDGDDSMLTPLATLPIEGQSATLIGLVGRVPAGFKLFPLRRIKTIDFDTTEAPKEKEEK